MYLLSVISLPHSTLCAMQLNVYFCLLFTHLSASTCSYSYSFYSSTKPHWVKLKYKVPSKQLRLFSKKSFSNVVQPKRQTKKVSWFLSFALLRKGKNNTLESNNGVKLSRMFEGPTTTKSLSWPKSTLENYHRHIKKKRERGGGGGGATVIDNFCYQIMMFIVVWNNVRPDEFPSFLVSVSVYAQ